MYPVRETSTGIPATVAARRPKYLRSSHPCVGGRLQDVAAQWALYRQRGHAFAHVLDRDVQAARVHPEPAQRRIGGRPAVALLVQPGDRPIVHDKAVFVAPGRVVDAADGELVRVARDHAVDEPRRVRAGDEILVERRDIDERGRLADGVVLDLVGVVIRAGGEIARPFPPLLLAVERRRARIERGSYRHRGTRLRDVAHRAPTIDRPLFGSPR